MKNKIIISKDHKSIFIMEKKERDEHDICENCKFEPCDHNDLSYCNFCMQKRFVGYRIKSIHKLSDKVEII